MSREVRHDGMGALQIRFGFDRELVDLVKTLPTRRWNAAERYWWVPETDVVQLVELLHGRRFRFDAATCELYRDFGGTSKIEQLDPPRPPRPQPPGLFDELEAPVATDGADDYTVSRLNGEVKQVIEGAFPHSLWLVGEISGFNRNAHKRHVTFQLAEKDDGGQTVSSVNATLFDRDRRAVDRALADAGEPFRLEDEVTVRMRVRVELYVPWGSYRVLVEELDVRYTLGEAARRREEIVRKLTEQGLIGLNTSLSLAPLPLRVGLITSVNSDAYNDVLRTFEESGFAFRVVAHGARVQGRATEPSVLNALDWFRDRAAEFDLVIVCRGGGSRTDLAWFDSEALGRAVARFPLPVIVGIGHEQDHSVLDAVGWRLKTPTAAAAFVVERVGASLQHVEDLGGGLLELAGRSIREADRAIADRGRRLARAARAQVERGQVQLDHRRSRVVLAARTTLGSAAERLGHQALAVPRATAVLLARQGDRLAQARRVVAHGARREIAVAARRVSNLAQALAPRAARRFEQEAERLSARGRRLELVDPHRVIERGYAVLRHDGGPVVKAATEAPPGVALRAELKCGTLRLRSEGPSE